MAVKKEKVQIDVELQGKLAKNSINELKAMAKGLNKEIADLKPGTEEFKKKMLEIQTTKKVMKDLRKEVNTVKTEVDAAKQSVTLWGRAMTGFGKISETAGAAFQKAFFFIEVIKQAYDAVAAFVELGAESNKLQKGFRNMGVTNDQEVKALSGRVQALSKVYGQESSQIQKTANTMAKSFGISMTEALNQIENNLMTSDNDEMLEVLNEYAIQFREAGFSAQEFNDILLSAEGAGAYSVDKVADMYKEFGLRVREQTKTTTDALAVLGTGFRDKLFKGINDGSITTQQAFEQIVTRMNEMGVATKDQQTIIADVFGGPGEDLGWPIITELQKTQKGMKELDADTKAYQEAQREYVKIVEGALTTFGSVAEGIKKFFVQLIGQSGPLVDVYRALWKSITDVWDAVTNLLEAFGLTVDKGSAAAGIINVLRFALTTIFTPIKFVVDSFTKLVNLFTESYKEGGLLTTVVNTLGYSFLRMYNQYVKPLVDLYLKLRGWTMEQLGFEVPKEPKPEPEPATPATPGTPGTDTQGKDTKKKKPFLTPEELEKRRKEKEAAAKAEAERLKLEADTERKIQAMRTGLMQEGMAKQAAMLEQQAAEQIANLKGTDEQIAEQTRLIRTKLEMDLDNLKAAQRDKDLAEELETLNFQRTVTLEAEKTAYNTQVAELMAMEELTAEERARRLKLLEETRRMQELEAERSQLEAELQLRTDYDELTFLREQEIQNRLTEIEMEGARIRIGQKEEEAKTKLSLMQAEMDMQLAVVQNSQALFSEMSNLAGKQSAFAKMMLGLQKAAAVAEITISAMKEIAMHNATPQNALTAGGYGAVMTGLVKARAAVGIATVLATGWAAGGYTGPGRGNPDRSGKRPAGVVHANEYVMPEWLLRTPEGAMLAQNAEAMRLRGFAMGGYTSGATTGSAIATQMPAPTQPASVMPPNLAEAMMQFAAAISQPLQAKAHVNPFELDEFYKEYQAIRTRAGS